ncbi:F0F1 ATP synthase subunit C [Mycoplasmopsis cynos]|uniref:F0F1 ATP synthase subunit C n=1 Tax=Mycoplasmopsis cynos TaxID=171284 RepID=UPI0024CDE67B|nr:F0F1 ATP synthase subunit C [Mycoplasmopsis cynos]WAM10724.1 F0F1 ATP synthase subunit C [Mycoplasmopsis cynos]
MGAGLGEGSYTAKAVEAVGRNPEAESKIRLMLIIGAGIAETTALFMLTYCIFNLICLEIFLKHD